MKRTRKPGLTEQRHQELGVELGILYHRLVELAVETGNAYPLSSGAHRHASAAYHAVNDLRHTLEDFAPSWRVYYPDDASDEDLTAAWERIVLGYRRRQDARHDRGEWDPERLAAALEAS